MFPRCVYLSYIKSKLTSHNFSTTSICLRNHYDSLGITPKATQSDIKASYYKLSMLYHPDKNKGSTEASKKFQDISAAYEVLGNYKLRRLYDKGILHTAGHQFAQESVVVEDDHPEAKFYRSRMDRHSVPNMSGKTPIYNFDEWSRAHYGATFERSQRARVKYQEKVAKMERDQIDIKNERVLMAIMALFVLFLMISQMSQRDYDAVRKNGSARNSK